VTCDFAIVGAGVFGSWCAHFLRKIGASVLLIEQHAPGNSRSSSGGESRIIRMGYGSDEIYTRMSQRSLILWRELFDRTGEDLFPKTGVLWLAQAGDAYAHDTEATLRRFQIPTEHLDGTQIARRFPQISCNGIDWALWEPESGVLMARRAVAATVKDAICAGVEYRTAAILPLADDKSAKLESISTTAGHRVSAAQFVFCCGPWLPKIFPGLLRDRLFITRQEVFFFGTPAGNASFRTPQFPTWLEMAAGMYGMPDIDARGAKLAIDTHGVAFDPDTGERTPSDDGLAKARAYLSRRFPALHGAPLTEARVCQYENTSNGDFLIDRHPDLQNVWLVGGGSGHGFKHGPAVGEYVSTLLTSHMAKKEPRFSLASKATRQSRAVY
jgi:sarcosine oxidase